MVARVGREIKPRPLKLAGKHPRALELVGNRRRGANSRVSGGSSTGSGVAPLRAFAAARASLTRSSRDSSTVTTVALHRAQRRRRRILPAWMRVSRHRSFPSQPGRAHFMATDSSTRNAETAAPGGPSRVDRRSTSWEGGYHFVTRVTPGKTAASNQRINRPCAGRRAPSASATASSTCCCVACKYTPVLAIDLWPKRFCRR